VKKVGVEYVWGAYMTLMTS